MTLEERTVVSYHLDQLVSLLDARSDLDGLRHVLTVQKILGGAHGAQSHAPNKRGRRKKAETVVDPETAFGTK